MNRAHTVVGTVLLVVLLTTTPVVATVPVASQDHGPPPDSSLDTDGGRDAAIDRYWYPYDRDVWEYDGNYDARINYSEAYDAYEDYLDGVVTWETYLAVSGAYDDDEPVVYPDPDEDGMTIREESVWSDHGGTFGKYTPDIDRDGFVDARDRRPSTEDVPPEINLTMDGTLFGRTYTAGAQDPSGISRLRATYETDTGVNVTYAGDGRPDTTGPVVPATLTGVDRAWITAEDTNGNEQTVVLGFEDGGSNEILGASTLVGGGTTVEYPSMSSQSIEAVSVTAMVTPARAYRHAPVGGEVHRRYERVTADGTTTTIEAPAYASPAVETYPTPGAYDWISPDVRDAVGEEDLPIRLPEGFNEEVGDPAGGSLYRGQGWEHIQNRAPGITRRDIGTVLRYPDALYDRGERTVVVGDGPGTPHDVVLTVVGGVIVSATNGEYVDDPLDGRVLHDRNDEHPVRGRDRAADHDEIEETISDSDEVWQNDHAARRTYLKRIDGRWLAVDVGRDEGVWTVLTAVDRGDSYPDVEDWLKRRGYGVPGDRVYTDR